MRLCLTHSDNGFIKILRAGLYVVYSHLAVTPGKCDNPKYNACPFQQLMRRQRRSSAAHDAGDQILLSDHIALGNVALDSREPTYTSVVFGVVRLSVDDLLRVEVSKTAKLHSTNRASYWGLFQLVV